MEPDVALATAKRRRLAQRNVGTLSRIEDGGKSGPPKSPPGNAEIFLAFRETTQTTAVRTLRFSLKEESGLPLATNGNDANDGGSDAAFRPQRRVRTSACGERKRTVKPKETQRLSSKKNRRRRGENRSGTLF